MNFKFEYTVCLILSLNPYIFFNNVVYKYLYLQECQKYLKNLDCLHFFFPSALKIFT